MSGYLSPFTSEFDPTLAAWVAAGWLLAGAPLSYLIARLMGHDLMHEGAASAGFSAVSRVLGTRVGILAALADAAKAGVVVWLASHYATYEVAGWTAVAAMLGYQWPIWMRFRGGRGLVITLAMVNVLGIWEVWIGISCMLMTRYLVKDSAPGVFLGTTAAVVVAFLVREPGPLPTFALIFCALAFLARMVGYRPASEAAPPSLPVRLAARLVFDRDTFARAR